MNTLSLLIYLADAAGNLKGFTIFVAAVFGILAGGSLFIWATTLKTTDWMERSLPQHVLEEKRQTGQRSWRWFCVFCPLMIASGIMASLVPSRQTVLLIAASEMGEQVLNHPRVNQVMDPGIELLTTWMQRETQALRGSIEGARR